MEKTLHGEFKLSGNDAEKQKLEHSSPSPKEHSSVHFFSAFGTFPDNIVFQEQKNGETIHLFVRRHFVTNVPWIVFSIILSILPIFFPFIFSSFPFPVPSPLILTLALFFYYLLIFGFVLLEFTLWYFHISFATNFRVVDIDITGILFRNVAEAKNEDIEDVTYSQNGFIASLFNYGDIHLQTAGSMQNIEFDRIPRPAEAARIIGDLAQTAPKD